MRVQNSSAGRRVAIAIGLAATIVGVLSACDSTSSPSAAAVAATTPSAANSTAPATLAPVSAGQHMITNQGHQLAFYVTPGHAPAIVLDAGGGLDASYWKKIAPVLAKATGSEIISYDRSGMGSSPEVPGPWRVQDAVSDLEAGLASLGATQDVVLVSHSLAGEIATYATLQHPGQFAGAVLVDASLPQLYTDTETARLEAAGAAQIAAVKGKPSTKSTRQLLALAADFVPIHQAYHEVVWPVSVPVIVIESAQTPYVGSAPDVKAWRAAQAEFAAAAPNRSLVTAARSSHDIPLDRPDVVEAQVEKMVKSVG